MVCCFRWKTLFREAGIKEDYIEEYADLFDKNDQYVIGSELHVYSLIDAGKTPILLYR